MFLGFSLQTPHMEQKPQTLSFEGLKKFAKIWFFGKKSWQLLRKKNFFFFLKIIIFFGSLGGSCQVVFYFDQCKLIYSEICDDFSKDKSAVKGNSYF